MKKQKKKLYLLIIIIFTILVLGSGYWYFFIREVYDQNSLPTRFVSYEFVSSRTEAKLYYPGSSVFTDFGESSTRAGYAHAGAVLTSKDSQEQIYSWYRDWLLAHGWHYDRYAFVGLADTQTSLQGYVRGEREKFYVAMDEAENLGWTLGKKVPTDATVFEVDYFINPAPTPTPTQIPIRKER